ncbi:MAG: N-acetylmuramoyl-L-alanine amidase [Bdellovibrionales bacterium]
MIHMRLNSFSPCIGMILLSSAMAAPPSTTATDPIRVVVLDSGHDPERPSDRARAGAAGTCGQPEVKYNDDVTEAIFARFNADRAYKAILTRRAGQEVDISHLSPSRHAAHLSPTALARLEDSRTLIGRAAIANSEMCDLFISIHHDSTLAEFQEGHPNCNLDPITQRKGNGIRLKAAFKKKYKLGYNIIVYEDDTANPRRIRESKRLATLIAIRFQKNLQRVPSNYHGRDGDCLNADGTPDCRDVDPQLGIIHKNVAVLRETRCPAVLIEVGNIADGGKGGDEQMIRDATFRKKLAVAVKQAVDDYWRTATEAR